MSDRFDRYEVSQEASKKIPAIVKALEELKRDILRSTDPQLSVEVEVMISRLKEIEEILFEES